MKKKRMFKNLDEMNQEDSAKGTQMVQIGIDVISIDKVKGGCKVAMGMPESALYDIMNQKRIPFLVLVDKDEYFKREKIEETGIAKTGIELIAQERREQIEKHGWSLDHDKDYADGQLLQAAEFCLDQARQKQTGIKVVFQYWPKGWLKHFEDKIRNKSVIGQLTVAGAFYLAEQDRTGQDYSETINQIAAEIDRLEATVERLKKFTPIQDELERAERKHPDFPDDMFHQLAIMQEEAGEVTKAVLHYKYEGGSFEHIREELIQTGAMCMRMLQNMRPL